MRLIMAVAGLAARLAGAESTGCRPIDTAEVRGRDVAAAIPAFVTLPPETVFGTMPPPGNRKTFRPAELLSLARRYAIALESAPEICFEWATGPLKRERVLSAMQDALQVPGARIEVLETSLDPAPDGVLEFLRSNLGTPASPDPRVAVIWRGDVIYGGGRRYRIWARVRISVPCERLIAVAALKAGVPILAGQVRPVPSACFPEKGSAAVSAGETVGLVLQRAVAAGAEIRGGMLAPPYDVQRGEMVEVEVVSGTTRLALTAEAQAAGRAGDLVAVRNPASNRVFQARVSGRHKVLVLASHERSD
jgi:flagella basal body P-ring formation protein FlgA